MKGRFARIGALALALAAAAAGPTALAAQANELAFTFATTLETQLKYTHSLEITDGLGAQLWASASPVSTKLGLKGRWLPLPFLVFSAEATAGTAWNIPIANGLALNERGASTGDQNLIPADFGGLVWSVEAGGTFQFDLAAIVPGDWNHIVFLSYHGAKYRAFTGADADVSWLVESDTGENRNGWNYYGNAFLGYQMPLRLNTIGFLAEADLYLYDTAGREAWGDHLPRWTIGILGNVTLGPRLSLALIVQAQSERQYTQATKDFDYYQDRILATETPSWAWYRAAMILSYRF